MKKIISKKNMHAVRRAVCALLIIAMLSPALSVGAEAVDTAAAETSKATAVSVETPNQGTAAVEDSGTDIGSGTSASEESGTTPKGDTDTTEEDTDASEEDTTDAKKDSTVSDNEVTESEEGSTISDNEVTESEEDSSVSDNEVTVSENEAALSGNDVSSALIDNKAGEGVLAEPKATLYVKQGKVESMNDLPEADELSGAEISLTSPLYMKLVWEKLDGVIYDSPYEYPLPEVLGNSENVHNGTVQLKDDTEISGLNASSSAELNADWEGLQLLNKDGTFRIKADKYYLDWTLTVNTAGNHFVSLQVADTLGKSLTLDEKSLEVRDKDKNKTRISWHRELIILIR